MISLVKCCSWRILKIRYVIGIVLLLFVVTNVLYTSMYLATRPTFFYAKQLAMNFSSTHHIAINRSNADQLTRKSSSTNIDINHQFNAEPFTTNYSSAYIAMKRLNAQPFTTNFTPTHIAFNRSNAQPLIRKSSTNIDINLSLIHISEPTRPY